MRFRSEQTRKPRPSNSSLARLYLQLVRLGSVLILANSLAAFWPEPAQAFETPDEPVVLIHGINGSASSSWGDFKDFLVQNGWTFGGSPTYDSETESVYDAQQGAESEIVAGDFYTMNMSDFADSPPSQSLTFREQGFEVAAVVSEVLSKNSGKSAVKLVGQSMGGLAARAYLQGLASKGTPVAWRGDVSKLITVGTPHQGAHLPTVCIEDPILAGHICAAMGLEPASVAMDALRADSLAMLELNDLLTDPLPGSVSYTSFVNSALPLILFDFLSGDGVVWDHSQNLSNIGGSGVLDITTVPIFVRARIGCGFRGFGWEESHTCAPHDIAVWAEILRSLLQSDALTLSVELGPDPVAPGEGLMAALTVTNQGASDHLPQARARPSSWLPNSGASRSPPMAPSSR